MPRHLIITIICLLILTSQSTCICAIFVDANAPGPIYNGTSWAKAFKSITSAINSISLGGDIWIKNGVYHEQLVLSKYINLYGGFLGNETSTSQRILGAFPTIIEANRKGRAIDISKDNRVTIDGCQ